jgi:hypothetical protein
MRDFIRVLYQTFLRFNANVRVKVGHGADNNRGEDIDEECEARRARGRYEAG